MKTFTYFLNFIVGAIFLFESFREQDHFRGLVYVGFTVAIWQLNRTEAHQ